MKRVLVVLSLVLFLALSASVSLGASVDLVGPSDTPWMRIGFDPQPEPPGYSLVQWSDPQEHSGDITLEFSIYEFDPQPEPPGFGIPIYFSFDDDAPDGSTLVPTVSGNTIVIRALNSAGEPTTAYSASFSFSTPDGGNLTGASFLPLLVGGWQEDATGAWIPALGSLGALAAVAPSVRPSALAVGFEFFLFVDPSTVAAGVEPSPFYGDAVLRFSLLDSDSKSVELNIVPEPGTLLLLGTGLVGLAGYGRKRRQ